MLPPAVAPAVMAADQITSTVVESSTASVWALVRVASYPRSSMMPTLMLRRWPTTPAAGQ